MLTHMRTIQLMMEEELLREADREAQRTRKSRSELIREALRERLHRSQIAVWEEEERRAYRKHPLPVGEVEAWAGVQVWPED